MVAWFHGSQLYSKWADFACVRPIPGPGAVYIMAYIEPYSSPIQSVPVLLSGSPTDSNTPYIPRLRPVALTLLSTSYTAALSSLCCLQYSDIALVTSDVACCS